MGTPQMALDRATKVVVEIENALKAGHPPPGEKSHGMMSAITVGLEAAGYVRSGSRETVRRAELKFRPINWKLYKPAEHTMRVHGGDPMEVRAILAERALVEAKAALNRAHEDIATVTHELQTVKVLRKARIPEAKWPLLKTAKGRVELTPLVLASDFQAGEVIRGAEIEGINAFDRDVFMLRYQALIQKTIDLSFVHSEPVNYPGIFYCNAGDVISNEFHDSLAETNDVTAIPAIRLVMQAEREGIRRLRDKFGRVRVCRVYGNHDRVTMKPRSKGSRGSFGQLLSWWLESQFEGDPKVTFHYGESPDLLMRIYDWNVLMSHGDKMGSKGGGGFIGPEAAIIRGHHQLYRNWSDGGHRPDVILSGHFHTQLQTVRGFANGALAGYSDFARDLRAIPDAPKQWLLYFHPKLKVSRAESVVLGDLPRRQMEVVV